MAERGGSVNGLPGIVSARAHLHPSPSDQVLRKSEVTMASDEVEGLYADSAVAVGRAGLRVQRLADKGVGHLVSSAMEDEEWDGDSGQIRLLHQHVPEV